ncbi:FMN-binding protein [Streptomyces sp. NPDC059568]|uniref:FMN-binding protein n=1 Tax=Streptomyces sp. NPDC059568 TaxID=3346868 RepID=UPI0036B16B08
MRRAVLAAASTSALVVLMLSLKPHHSAVPSGGTSVSARAPTPAPASSGTALTDGMYTGDPVNTQYGTVQVSATVKAGRLTAVTVLRTPSGDGRSRQIATDAVPRLTQEALSAHSAHIDAVSGASYTSQGYIQSLQSALDRAGG